MPDAQPPDRVAVALILAVAARVVLDLLWQIDAPVPEANLPRVACVLMTAGFAIVAWRGRASLAQDALRWPILAFFALLALGVARAPDPTEATRSAIRYASPLLLALAVKTSLPSERDRALLPVGIASAGLVPIGWSLYRMATGRPDFVQDGLPRHLGGYQNLHSHAIAMALLASVGLFLLLESPRGWTRVLGGVVAIGAGVALMSTWVRTGMLFVLVVVLGLLALRRRWTWIAGVSVASVGAVLASPALRARFADVWSVITLTPPAGGWDALGSGRLAIWHRSFAAFTDLGAQTVALGTGLGGHLHFWKGKNPHDEFLLLWYQVGVLGPVVFAALLAMAGWQAWQRRDAPGIDGALARFAVALTAGVLLVSAISNAFLDRLTAAWLYWALAAAATVPQGPMRASSADVATPASRNASS